MTKTVEKKAVKVVKKDNKQAKKAYTFVDYLEDVYTHFEHRGEKEDINKDFYTSKDRGFYLSRIKQIRNKVISSKLNFQDEFDKVDKKDSLRFLFRGKEAKSVLIDKKERLSLVFISRVINDTIYTEFKNIQAKRKTKQNLQKISDLKKERGFYISRIEAMKNHNLCIWEEKIDFYEVLDVLMERIRTIMPKKEASFFLSRLRAVYNHYVKLNNKQVYDKEPFVFEGFSNIILTKLEYTRAFLRILVSEQETKDDKIIRAYYKKTLVRLLDIVEKDFANMILTNKNEAIIKKERAFFVSRLKQMINKL